MAETLDAFIKRQLRIVEEDGKNVTSIHLTPVDGDGTPFDSWYAPLGKDQGGPGPEGIADEVETLCHGYAEQFPKGKSVQFAVICRDKNGSERGRHLKQVFGQNVSSKGGAGLLGGDQSIAEGARIHVETTKGLLNTMVANFSIMGEQLRGTMEQNSALMYLLMNERMTHARDADTGDEPVIHPQVKYIMEKLVEASGPLASIIMSPRAAGPTPTAQPPVNGASKPS